MKQLVFVHGRAQEHKNAAALKAEWIASWRKGLDDAGLAMPVADTAIRFPYYGDTLYDLASGLSVAEAAAVIMKGMRDPGDGAAPIDPEQRAFVRDVLLQVERERGIPVPDRDVT